MTMDLNGYKFQDGFIVFPKPISDLKQGILLHIQFSYQTTYKEFSEINPLATELYYAQMIYENQKEQIQENKKKVDFFFNPENLEIEDVDIIFERDHYWYYELYQLFLAKRIEYLKSQPQQIEQHAQTDQENENETWNKVSNYLTKHDVFFKSKKDFLTWKDLIISLAENKKYKIPQTEIVLKSKKKSEFATILNTILDELQLKDKIEEFYKINKILSEFSKYENSTEFKQYISRKGRLN
jgi:hypothetical protein